MVDLFSDIEEQWRNVPGFEGHYAVSNMGQIYSFNVDRIMSRLVHKKTKHCSIVLTKRGVPQRFYIHRLVMLVFVGPCPPGMEVLHLDDNPLNNRLSNLKYGTRKENIRQCVNNGRFIHNVKGRYGADNFKSIPIRQYALDGTFLREFAGIADAARATGKSGARIHGAIKNQRPSNGFLYTYAHVLTATIKELPRTRKDSRKINQYDMQGNFIASYSCITEAAEKTGCDDRKICAVCKGYIGRKSTRGFVFKYAD